MDASAHCSTNRPSEPTLLELCERALYVGYSGYGGPAVLAHIKKTFVDEKDWLSERDFMTALSLAQILPGATGVSLMGYIGHKLRRPWGGILLPVCYVLPAALRRGPIFATTTSALSNRCLRGWESWWLLCW